MFLLAAGLILMTAALQPASAQAPRADQVDLHLVLAVDVSWSMDPEEQRLQRDGYVLAFRDPAVHKAIASGQTGRIAVTYFEWAGAEIHFLVIPWTIVDSPAAAHRIADELAQRRISRHRMTSISSALQYADRLLKEAPGEAARKVIDVSGDGPNNSGVSPVTKVRDEVLATGVVINGLPIMLKAGNPDNTGFGQDINDLDDYYANCVIGGPGSFMIPILKPDEFASATRQKLLQEISSITPRTMRAQMRVTPPAGSSEYDCEVGEKNWRRYYLDRGRW
jgi:Protein of unknown function (DUF1194)